MLSIPTMSLIPPCEGDEPPVKCSRPGIVFSNASVLGHGPGHEGNALWVLLLFSSVTVFEPSLRYLHLRRNASTDQSKMLSTLSTTLPLFELESDAELRLVEHLEVLPASGIMD